MTLPPRQPDVTVRTIGFDLPDPPPRSTDPGVRHGHPRVPILVAIAIPVALFVVFAALFKVAGAAPASTPPGAVPASPVFRVYQLGGERVGPLTVCGSEAANVAPGGSWGSEGQMCVAVYRREWLARRPVAVVCGTQVYAVNLGQPCQ